MYCNEGAVAIKYVQSSSPPVAYFGLDVRELKGSQWVADYFHLAVWPWN